MTQTCSGAIGKVIAESSRATRTRRSPTRMRSPSTTSWLKEVGRVQVTVKLVAPALTPSVAGSKVPELREIAAVVPPEKWLTRRREDPAARAAKLIGGSRKKDPDARGRWS